MLKTNCDALNIVLIARCLVICPSQKSPLFLTHNFLIIPQMDINDPTNANNPVLTLKITVIIEKGIGKMLF